MAEHDERDMHMLMMPANGRECADQQEVQTKEVETNIKTEQPQKQHGAQEAPTKQRDAGSCW